MDARIEMLKKDSEVREEVLKEAFLRYLMRSKDGKEDVRQLLRDFDTCENHGERMEIFRTIFEILFPEALGEIRCVYCGLKRFRKAKREFYGGRIGVVGHREKANSGIWRPCLAGR